MVMINIALKFLASGSYVTIYIYANETFPTHGRNTGMGVCSMVARAGAIIGTFSNDHLVNICHFTFVLCIISFRLEHGNIFPLLSMELLLYLLCYSLQFFQKRSINHCHKQSLMLNEWVLLGKLNKKVYFIIIFISLCSSFGRSMAKRNVHVNGHHNNGEDALLKKQLKEDVDF
jgi:hypothetical protein